MILAHLIVVLNYFLIRFGFRGVISMNKNLHSVIDTVELGAAVRGNDTAELNYKFSIFIYPRNRSHVTKCFKGAQMS